jgi:hypothetical protein
VIPLASFMDWSMRDPRALSIVAVIYALLFGPTIVRIWKFERRWRETQHAPAHTEEKGEGGG